MSSFAWLISLVRGALNPLIVILLVAGIAEAFLGEKSSASLIGLMVLLSSGLNVWMTYRSERAAELLKMRVTPTATTARNGRWVELPRRKIVPGDLIRLSAGDLVPADARLVQASDLHVDQAALTGESTPAAKSPTGQRLTDVTPDSPDLVFLGSSVASGTGLAIVFGTGRNTIFGDVLEAFSERPAETEFDRGMRRFGMLILKTVIFLVLFILLVNVSLGRDPLQSLLFSVALAVGLTPEFLPMITTVTLAEGARQMARQKVLVKHLASIQNLGSIDILCSDKTGTLTAGTMSVDASLGPLGAPSGRALFLAHINSQCETGIKSPFDNAILARPMSGVTGYVKTDEIPFDFKRRRLSVVVAKDGTFTLITKGAPESVLEACTGCEIRDAVITIDENLRAKILEQFCSLSEKGFRTLAVAYRNVPSPSGYEPADESALTFSGFVSFSDHLLEGVPEWVSTLRRDGVRIKILSGDNELVTRHICLQAGMVGADQVDIVTGKEIDQLNDVALGKLVARADLFARVSPAQKHRIIIALKAQNHVVGFLGDGINDAPSLHDADVGISVAGAVDIARESSDIILLERRLDVLHAGILSGRQSFGNVFKYLLMGTSSNFGNMFSMAAAALFLPFLPMLPGQILLNNFLYDLAQVTIPTDNVDPAYIRGPQRWDIRLVRNFMVSIGPVSSIFDFVTFFALLKVFHFGEKHFQTGWFVESLATQILVIFVIRTVGRPWANKPSALLTATALGAVFIGCILPFLPHSEALGFTHLSGGFFLFLLVVVIVYLALVELVKERVIRRILEQPGR